MKILRRRINKIMSKYKQKIKTHVWHLPYLSHTRDAAEQIAWKDDMNL